MLYAMDYLARQRMYRGGGITGAQSTLNWGISCRHNILSTSDGARLVFVAVLYSNTQESQSIYHK
jgi:hypothetical protein